MSTCKCLARVIPHFEGFSMLNTILKSEFIRILMSIHSQINHGEEPVITNFLVFKVFPLQNGSRNGNSELTIVFSIEKTLKMKYHSMNCPIFRIPPSLNSPKPPWTDLILPIYELSLWFLGPFLCKFELFISLILILRVIFKNTQFINFEPRTI